MSCIWTALGMVYKSPLVSEVREKCGEIYGVLTFPRVAVETRHPRVCLVATP